MRSYLVTAAVAVASVAIALAFFAAGYLAHDWVDQERGVSVQRTAQPTVAPPVATATPVSGAPAVVSLSVEGRPTRGSAQAAVTIVEFSDFQCTFCKSYVDQTLPLVLAMYGDRVRYTFWNFPISRLHPQAQQAAEASLCADEQGKFWEYHDQLFKNQGALDAAGLKQHARTVGLDGGKFDTCLDSGRYTAEVKQDYDEALAGGVTGTPTFLINGRKLVGAQPFTTLQRIIDEELAKASAR